MSSRGLPGFLRRTLRVDYSFDEDEDNDNNTATGGDDETAEPPPAADDGDAPDHANNNEQEEEIAFERTQAPLASSSESTAAAAGAAAPISETNNNGGSSLSSYEVVESESNAEKGNGTESSGQGVAPKYAASTGNQALDLQTEPPQSPPRSYREVQFDKVMSADVINMEELRKLAWNGIPNRHRAAAWKILLGYLPTNQSRRAANLTRKRGEYKDAVRQHYDIDDDTRTAQEQETLRQVLVDVPRTAPEVGLFRNERIRRILARLLYVWAMRHPASSYVQGINDLATPLLVVFLADYYKGEDVLDGHVMNHLSDERLDELEADVYWCLTNLLSGIQDHYTSDQPGVQRDRKSVV